jgi:hypothetical protein
MSHDDFAETLAHCLFWQPRVFLGNGRFAESKSGDWFDLPLNGRGIGIRTKKLHFLAGVVARRSVMSGKKGTADVVYAHLDDG